MTEYIYGDVLFIINFSMDFIALFICGKIMHFKMSFWRMALAATLGGVYGGYIYRCSCGNRALLRGSLPRERGEAIRHNGAVCFGFNADWRRYDGDLFENREISGVYSDRRLGAYCVRRNTFLGVCSSCGCFCTYHIYFAKAYAKKNDGTGLPYKGYF